MRIGSDNPSAILTEKDVIEIKQWYEKRLTLKRELSIKTAEIKEKAATLRANRMYVQAANEWKKFREYEYQKRNEISMFSTRVMAKKWRVSESTIKGVIRGDYWSHAEPINEGEVELVMPKSIPGEVYCLGHACQEKRKKFYSPDKLRVRFCPSCSALNKGKSNDTGYRTLLSGNTKY